MLTYDSAYSKNDGQVAWCGKTVAEQTEFSAFLCGPTRYRLFDEVQRTQYEADLRALATTEMASDTITRLIASEPNREPWEVGEALAECFLEKEGGVRFPWNNERDKRTPKASLPGADLVGFLEEGDEVLLVLGEVKTSGDTNNPPQVMYGRGGMVHQLDNLASDISIHNCLLKWLHSRCKNTPLWPLYEKAARRYLASGGREIKLIGMLMRDTKPNELDLKNRARFLALRVSPPTKVELDAWYLPVPIKDWMKVVQRGAV